jgi:hypothetical protein
MAWPDMHDVDSYCDYNNGLFEHKVMMIGVRIHHFSNASRSWKTMLSF